MNKSGSFLDGVVGYASDLSQLKLEVGEGCGGGAGEGVGVLKGGRGQF